MTLYQHEYVSVGACSANVTTLGKMVCCQNAGARTSTLNASLADKLDAEFESRGIVAYTRCCRASVCTGTYADSPDWKRRQQGVHYFQFALGGEWCYSPVGLVSVHYFDRNFLLYNWEAETAIIRQWCAVIGVTADYIQFPDDEDTTIVVVLRRPIGLETC